MRQLVAELFKELHQEACKEACKESKPELREIEKGRFVACHRIEDIG